MTDKEISLEKAIQKIHQRGNSVEIQRTKDGLKVFEVKKTLVMAVKQDKE